MSGNAAKVTQIVSHHKDVITCLIVSPDGSLLIRLFSDLKYFYMFSGSRDTTLGIWTVRYSKGKTKTIVKLSKFPKHILRVVSLEPLNM